MFEKYWRRYFFKVNWRAHFWKSEKEAAEEYFFYSNYGIKKDKVHFSPQILLRLSFQQRLSVYKLLFG